MEQWRRNIAYYNALDDKNLMLKHQEASDIWFGLLMKDSKLNMDSHLETLAFWEHVMQCTEHILKERSLIPESKHL
jgi:hypothetical protein